MDRPAPVLVALYVPGDRPDRFRKALAAGADQVILDLEDAVAPERKDYARQAVGNFLAEAAAPVDQVAVRPNGGTTPWQAEDLAMLAALPTCPALRLPAVSAPEDVDAVLERLATPPSNLTCLLESALGVEHAFAIAVHPRVTGVALGEADLRAELGITAEAGLDWLRVRLVVAAQAAGLDPPQMAAFPGLDDAAGLAESCRHGASLGMLGRTAVHPRQVPVIREAFRPTADQLHWAEKVLGALGGATGVTRLPDGGMVDEAMAAQARRTLQLGRLLSDPS